MLSKYDLRSRCRDACLNRVPLTRRRVTFFCFASPRQLLSYIDVMNAENAGAFFCPALLSIAVPDAILPPPSVGSYLLHPCSRKESNQRPIRRERIGTPQAHEARAPGRRESAGDPLPLESCAATKTILGLRPAGQPMAVQICSGQICHFHRGVPEGPSMALCQRAASCRAPSGCFPVKAPVLGVANGTRSVPRQVSTA
jgi:hypothetical protein